MAKNCESAVLLAGLSPRNENILSNNYVMPFCMQNLALDEIIIAQPIRTQQ